MTDTISLRGVRVDGVHGVFEFERQRPQPFVVDVDLEADVSTAGETDGLHHTVNYADVVGHIQRIISWEPVNLIETLAERIAASCLTIEHVEAVVVTVHKPQAPLGVPFQDVSVTIRRERWRPAVVALGGNVGAVQRTLTGAVRRLDRCPGVRVRAVSRLFRSEAVVDIEAMPEEMKRAPQPQYLNAVLLCDTRLAASTLLRQLHVIEAEFGRTRTVRWGPRTLDLDLIQVGDPAKGTDLRVNSDTLTLPHPLAQERAFVVVPWVDVDPQAHMRVGNDVVPVAEVAAEVLGRTDADSAFGNVLAGHDVAAPDVLSSAGLQAGPEWEPTW